MARALIVLPCSDQAYHRFQNGGARELRRYAECLERAGARPVLLSPGQRRSQSRSCAALLLPGGPDVHPRFYGAAFAGAEETDRARDELELDLVDEAGRRGWPVLGICRGMQLLNVAFGGSLEQHIEGHRRPDDTVSALHSIQLVADSALARLLGVDGVLGVNSRHHQAVTAERLAPSLRAVALAGGQPEIVEALEARDGAWLLGVQCHPERCDEVPPQFLRLFEGLAQAATGATASAVTSEWQVRAARPS